MVPARFCSQCGERIKLRRTSVLPFCSFCPKCLPRVWRFRLMLIAIPALCAAIGFTLGHYTSPREPFYFLGTPVDLSATRVAPAAGNNGDHLSRGSDTLIAPGAAETICGARTRSGKPCQRKVKGGGYCWQHRNRQAPNEKGSMGSRR